MTIEHNFSLKKHNTFGLDVKAETFVSVRNTSELEEFLLSSPYKSSLKLVLGGGSNMLLTSDLSGTILHIDIKGKEIQEKNNTHAIIAAGAGENWHQLVLWAINQDLGGIENLSLIPGNIGTAPVQNIGAYGVELKDIFHSLDAIEIETGKQKSFTLEECKFGYRDSVFKGALKGKFIITTVRLKLKKAPHNLSTHYGAIQAELERQGVVKPTIKSVSDAVIAIRQSKLPDPKELGNSGSFFKNPVVTLATASELKNKFPEMPIYDSDNGQKKLAAGWLIEQAGLKGFRKGDAGVHKNQALVLVNYGKATGQEILEMAHLVIDTVFKKFGITLEPEVNII